MKTLKPVAAALATAGFIAVPNLAFAIDPISLTDLCGGAPVVAGAYFCSPSNPALTAACLINIPAGVDFSLSSCAVNAAGYPVTIRGSGTAKLTLNNGAISNAAKVELNFGNGLGNACGDAIDTEWSFDAASTVVIKAAGGVGADFRFAPVFGAGGVVADSLSVKSKFGDVCVTIGYSTSTTGIQTDKTEIKSDYGSTSLTGPPPP
jgi:hypothetical protein